MKLKKKSHIIYNIIFYSSIPLGRECFLAISIVAFWIEFDSDD